MTDDHLSRDTYVPLLNTKFRIDVTPNMSVDAELIKISDLLTRPRQEQFSILFLSGADTPAEQGLFAVHHETLGDFELFLVPVGSDEKGITFQAVFNKLVE
jgi:hypothetical protein